MTIEELFKNIEDKNDFDPSLELLEDDEFGEPQFCEESEI